MDRVGAVLVQTYRITRLIAEGGMGDVYEAQHVRVPKRFAVKFLKGALVDQAEALARFRREAEIIATLDHPNIVTLFDYNVGDDGVPYIVLELLDGEHLGCRIARGPMPLEEVVPIVKAVASALEVAHARDVIHRDLKPENVLLCQNGAIKVVDFGVAKLRGAEGLTAFNTTVGTVPYMSPEQILGGTLDGRTDEFALAAIAYEMLSGNTCFGGGGPAVTDQALRVLRHVPPPLGTVPESVNAVLLRALSKDAGDRFPTVKELADALADCVGATPRELPGESTAVTPVPDVAFPPTPPRTTAPSMVAPSMTERTSKVLRPWWPSPRTIAIAGGATLGVVLAFTIWLLAH